MWAKHFSVDLKWLKRVTVSAVIFAAAVTVILLGLKWDRIIYPNSFKEIERDVIIPNMSASTTTSRSDRLVLQSISNLLQSKNISVENIYVDGYRDVYMNTSLSQIIFSLKTDNQSLVNTLITIVDNKVFQDNQKIPQNVLEYIDIRFGNKVFYKYKNGKSIATTTIQTNILEQSTTTSR